MKKVKRFACFILTVLFAFAFCACGVPERANILSEMAEHTETQEEVPYVELPDTPPPMEEEEEASMEIRKDEEDPLKEITPEPAFLYPASDYTRYKAVCATANVNVRQGAGISHDVIGYIPQGSSLPYIDSEGNWYRVWLGERFGYVSKEYAYLAETNRTIERILEVGLSKLGTPYEWGAPRILSGDGGINPYFTGRSFDCSSFVQYCYYLGDGVKLGNYTGSQADHTVGTVITRYADLRRGDFYFTGNGTISHVVIYMGGGRLLQAYSANGGPVSLTSDERWRGKFISGRRVNLLVKEQYC